MDKQFDELSKSLAEGVSRRVALRKFGIGLAGVLLASLGLGSGRATCAQGSAQCCHWVCSNGDGGKGHRFDTTTCGSLCPDPSVNGYSCVSKGSKTVSDCTACK